MEGHQTVNLYNKPPIGWFRENEDKLRDQYLVVVSGDEDYDEREFRGWAYEKYLEGGV